MAHQIKFPVDDNNNVKEDKSKMKMKKKLHNVRQFFNEMMGKAGSFPIGLDGSTVEPKLSSTLKKKKRQESLPDLSQVEIYENFSMQTPNRHRKLGAQNSMPASLHIPHREPRSNLFGIAFNQSDMDEEWARSRSYPSKSSLDLTQSEVVSGNIERPSTGLPNRRAYTQGNMCRRSSQFTTSFSSIDEIASNHDPTSGRHRFKRGAVSNGDLARSYDERSRDLVDYRRNSALGNLRRLGRDSKSQSAISLIHVGSYICTVEKSSSNLHIDNLDKTDYESGNVRGLRRTTSDSSGLATAFHTHKTVKGVNTKKISDEKPITVQIKDEFFKPQNRPQRQTSHVEQSHVDTRDASANSSLPSSPQVATNIDNIFSNDGKSAENHDDVIMSSIIEPASEGRRGLVKSVSTTTDVLDESFTSSFWDDTNVVLTTDRIREISENEATQILCDCCYIEAQTKKWTKEISASIRDKIRAYTGRQFKIVINTFIGSLLPSNHDTVNFAVRGTTAPKDDRFIVCAFEKNDMFVSVTCVLIKN